MYPNLLLSQLPYFVGYFTSLMQELKEFNEQNGHCNVPKIYTHNPSLGYWVNEQRFQYRRLMKKKPSYMTQDKIKALNSLDFKVSNTCNTRLADIYFNIHGRKYFFFVQI